jgi:hypothetical protein
MLEILSYAFRFEVARITVMKMGYLRLYKCSSELVHDRTQVVNKVIIPLLCRHCDQSDLRVEGYRRCRLVTNVHFQPHAVQNLDNNLYTELGDFVINNCIEQSSSWEVKSGWGSQKNWSSFKEPEDSLPFFHRSQLLEPIESYINLVHILKECLFKSFSIISSYVLRLPSGFLTNKS